MGSLWLKEVDHKLMQTLRILSWDWNSSLMGALMQVDLEKLLRHVSFKRPWPLVPDYLPNVGSYCYSCDETRRWRKTERCQSAVTLLLRSWSCSSSGWLPSCGLWILWRSELAEQSSALRYSGSIQRLTHSVFNARHHSQCTEPRIQSQL